MKVKETAWLNDHHPSKVFGKKFWIPEDPAGQDPRKTTFRVEFEEPLPIKHVGGGDVKPCSGIEVLFDWVAVKALFAGDNFEPLWVEYGLPYGKESSLRLSLVKRLPKHTVRRWKNERSEEEVVLKLRISDDGSCYEFDTQGMFQGYCLGMQPMLAQRVPH